MIINSADTFDQWFNRTFAQFKNSNSSSSDKEETEKILSNEEQLIIIHRLHELLRTFILCRVKSEVLHELSKKKKIML